VLLTLLRAVGLQRASFGINNSLTSTGCSAIEA
jgi:hypothetical protein